VSHHDQQASDDQNQTEHGRMPSSNTPLLNLILLIDVTFSTPTPVNIKVGAWRYEDVESERVVPKRQGHEV
jgi:hypothetical protein